MKLILIFVVFCSVVIAGEADAPPASYSEYNNAVTERVEYATSLNPMASILMNWYGSLLKLNNNQTENQQTNNANIRFFITNSSWEKHRAAYPEMITGIQITSADINKQETPGQYLFEVDVLITYLESNTSRNKLFHEVFLFQTSDSGRPEIKQISRFSPKLENNSSDINQTPTFKHEYYKSREFAYAWLAYMDGVNTMGAQIDIDNWLDIANYSVKIGDFELDEQLNSSLQKRNQYLGKGGHLLRSVTTRSVEGKSHSFELDIIIDWKGTAPGGRPAIAKINQVIQYEFQEDGSLNVLFIKEKHLLPDFEPWQKLLC